MERRVLNAAIQSQNSEIAMAALERFWSASHHMYQGYDVFLDGLPINVFSVICYPGQQTCVVNYSGRGSRWNCYAFEQADNVTPPAGVVLRPKPGPNARKLRNQFKRYLARHH